MAAPESFNAPYVFKRDNVEVIIQNRGNAGVDKFGKYLRVKPGDEGTLASDGGKGNLARFEVQFNDGDSSKVRLKSLKSGKYIRMKKDPKPQDKDKIDVQGGTGPFTLFSVEPQDQPNIVKLRAVKPDNKVYLAVAHDGSITVGSGGPWCALKFIRSGGGGGGGGGGEFDKPYEFQKDNDIIIRHKGHGDGGNYNRSLRVKPGDASEADPDGGMGKLAQLKTEVLEKGDGGIVKIYYQDGDTKRYLRIQGNQEKINFGGSGGELTKFKVHKGDKKGNGRIAKLESVKFPGKYIAVQKNNKIAIGTGGTWTELLFLRKN